MINPMELTGKQILVAGSLSEIGQAVVAQLSQLGAIVVVVDQTGKKIHDLIKDDTNVSFYQFDIFSNSEIEPNLKRIVTECGQFDGFVYCAGIGGVRPLSQTKLLFMQEMMDANLYPLIEMVRCITKKNSFSQGGSIIAISSVSSIKGLKSKTAFSASKAALDAAVRCMAAELSDRKIRVNSILKGWVESDLKNDFIKTNMDLNESSDFRRQLLGVIDPVEIANTVAFLLCDATKSITGTSLLLDGGYTL
jgi:NAD(P)-dependent dehydrogenase (short-subunit alcohol dehydrogenase family)